MKSLEQALALREATKQMTPVERLEVVIDDYNVMTGRKVL